MRSGFERDVGMRVRKILIVGGWELRRWREEEEVEAGVVREIFF
jgi:hypothetical protein